MMKTDSQFIADINKKKQKILAERKSNAKKIAVTAASFAVIIAVLLPLTIHSNKKYLTLFNSPEADTGYDNASLSYDEAIEIAKATCDTEYSYAIAIYDVRKSLWTVTLSNYSDTNNSENIAADSALKNSEVEAACDRVVIVINESGEIVEAGGETGDE